MMCIYNERYSVIENCWTVEENTFKTVAFSDHIESVTSHIRFLSRHTCIECKTDAFQIHVHAGACVHAPNGM